MRRRALTRRERLARSRGERCWTKRDQSAWKGWPWWGSASTLGAWERSQQKRSPGCFRLHGPQVYRRALRLLGNATDAEEALQDVFLKILDRVDDFDDQDKTLNWLYRITTNHCLNVIRGRKRRLAATEAFRVAPQRADHTVAVDATLLRELLSG
ncbi:MAG: RNA polymerase sigma factor [bacterium]